MLTGTKPYFWHDLPLLNGTPYTEANLESWYTAGRHLFPRRTLQDTLDQLENRPAKGDVISVKGIDGFWYEFPVRTGDTETVNGVSWHLEGPCIFYWDIETLKDTPDEDWPQIYCPVTIAHRIRPPNTGQVAETVRDIESGTEVAEAWEHGEDWLQIRSRLLSLGLRRKFSKVIGLACGSYATVSNPVRDRRSIIEHAFLILLHDLLRDNQLASEDLTCYAQDPAYTEEDKRVLSDIHIGVLQDPEGFLEMDDRSLVFCSNPTTCVKSIVAEIARPMMIIWNRVTDDPATAGNGRYDPDCPRVREMIRSEYNIFDFPENNTFAGLAIYVKKEAMSAETIW
ncbi:hypothetical protein BJX64DRAFT_300442 [Aspergillus heterothallicus]